METIKTKRVPRTYMVGAETEAKLQRVLAQRNDRLKENEGRYNLSDLVNEAIKEYVKKHLK